MHDGNYQTEQTELLIDGKPWQSGEYLSKGKHTIALASGEPTRIQLRRTTKADGSKPTDNSVDLDKFLGYYGYHY